MSDFSKEKILKVRSDVILAQKEKFHTIFVSRAVFMICIHTKMSQA